MPARKMLVRTYWRVFNILVRLISILLLLGAAGMLIGVLISDGGDKPLLVMLAIIIGIPAILMLRAKGFRPDIDGYDSAFGRRSVESRAWWTGDVKQRSGPGAA